MQLLSSWGQLLAAVKGELPATAPPELALLSEVLSAASPEERSRLLFDDTSKSPDGRTLATTLWKGTKRRTHLDAHELLVHVTGLIRAHFPAVAFMFTVQRPAVYSCRRLYPMEIEPPSDMLILAFPDTGADTVSFGELMDWWARSETTMSQDCNGDGSNGCKRHPPARLGVSVSRQLARAFLPPTMLILFTRYHWDRPSNVTEVVRTFVTTDDDTVDLASWCDGRGPATYRVTGGVVQTGKVDFGHFVTAIRPAHTGVDRPACEGCGTNPRVASAILCNDSRVNHILDADYRRLLGHAYLWKLDREFVAAAAAVSIDDSDHDV